jgi:hypothetical protein
MDGERHLKFLQALAKAHGLPFSGTVLSTHLQAEASAASHIDQNLLFDTEA